MITLSFFFEINFKISSKGKEFLTNFFTYQITMSSKESLFSTVTPYKLTIFSLYFFTAHNNGSVSSPVSRKMLPFFSMFKCVHYVTKKRVRSFSYFRIICRNFATFNKCYFVVLRLFFQ